MKTRKYLILGILLLFLTTTISASVPVEYRNKEYMTDYDIWLVSKEHPDQKWAKYELELLLLRYTNGWRCYSCLDEVMIRKFETEVKVKFNKVQKLPKVPKVPKK
jgi:hypothetical protein